jgi:ABC-type transport system involved in cytochrome bd biosynthesis fused ATPase/permease subunit
MGWAEALKAAIIAIPKVLDAIERLGDTIAEAMKAAENRRQAEVREAQNRLEIEVMRVQHDEERARLARRISELERKL